VNYSPKEMEITQKDGFHGHELGQNPDEIPNFNALIFHPLYRENTTFKRALHGPDEILSLL
jgi:hypothetical protein